MEPGGSNVVIVPFLARTKPCNTLLASPYSPAITPAGLMPKPTVPNGPAPRHIEVRDCAVLTAHEAVSRIARVSYSPRNRPRWVHAVGACALEWALCPRLERQT